MRSLLAALLAAPLVASSGASAQGLAGMEKQILPMTRANWVAFRNYDGRQFVYFTQLLVYRCGLSAIHYGVNGGALSQSFPLPPCDAANPNAIDPVKFPPYIVGPVGAIDRIEVEVVYADGTVSDPAAFTPCASATGEEACAALEE